MLKELEANLTTTNDQYQGAQSAMDQLISKNPAGLDEALLDNGIIDRDICLRWLKNKIKGNVNQGYYDYVSTEADELKEVANDSDQW